MFGFPGQDIHVARDGVCTYYLTPGVTVGAVKEALATEGETLKASPKSLTRRVEGWVVKESTGNTLPNLIKHTAARWRYRRGWTAARFLASRGVGVPKARAFMEERAGGVIWRQAYLCDYLDGCENVEQFARRLVEGDATEAQIGNFLKFLAQAVNGLCGAPAYHADLSGKNIFTKTGAEFYFIDLDSCQIRKAPRGLDLLKNHVQLYDSFCDVWDDATLDPFLEDLSRLSVGRGEWLRMVKAGQAQRRAEQEAKWASQGRRGSTG